MYKDPKSSEMGRNRCFKSRCLLEVSVFVVVIVLVLWITRKCDLTTVEMTVDELVSINVSRSVYFHFLFTVLFSI